MNNKEFIAELSERLSLDQKETSLLAATLVSEMASHLEEEELLSIANFGTFEVKKKLERVVINPSTKQRMLVPPQLVINFKANTSLKDKVKNNK